MNKHFVLIALLVGFSSLFAKAALAAQPLTLYELFDNASNFYPLLKTAQLEARAANEDKDAVGLQRWATATLTAESQTGNLRSYPTNVLQVQQTIWDFGRLSARIAEAEATADRAPLSPDIPPAAERKWSV